MLLFKKWNAKSIFWEESWRNILRFQGNFKNIWNLFSLDTDFNINTKLEPSPLLMVLTKVVTWPSVKSKSVASCSGYEIAQILLSQPRPHVCQTLFTLLWWTQTNSKRRKADRTLGTRLLLPMSSGYITKMKEFSSCYL